MSVQTRFLSLSLVAILSGMALGAEEHALRGELLQTLVAETVKTTRTREGSQYDMGELAARRGKIEQSIHHEKPLPGTDAEQAGNPAEPKTTSLQVGDTVRTGQVYQLAEQAACESVLGINARILASGPAKYEIMDYHTINLPDKSRAILRVIHLQEGIMRVRVRCNIVDRCVLFVYGGNLGLVLDRGDLVIERKDGKTTVRNLSTDAGVLVKLASDDWTKSRYLSLPADRLMQVADASTGELVPQTMTKAQRVADLLTLAFSVDRRQSELPLPPRDFELEAP